MNNQRIKQAVLGLSVVAVVIGGVWLARRNKNQEENVSPEIILEPTKQMVEELPEAMTEVEKQGIEDKFASEGVEMTVLKDVSEGQAVGTAWRHFDGESFIHKVEASGLSALDKGYFYEGWLVGEDGFFSTGRMAVMDGKGILYYKADEDKTEFDGVVVSRETEDGDKTPGKHVLEGSF